MIQGSPCRLIFPLDVVQSAYGAPAGVYLDTELPSLFTDEAGRQQNTLLLGSTDGIRERGAIIRPLVSVATAADNEVTNVRVLTYRPVNNPVGNPKDGIGWIIEHIGDMVCTASATSIAKSKYGSSEAGNYRLIDTIAYTPTDLGTAIATAFGAAAQVFSPADDTQAQLVLTDLGGAYGLILDPIDDNGFNALCEAMT
tara:strand:+ start:149 stop:742 length:594 start_codon:yes stop_codon:yes gene_type:complete